MSDEVGDKDDLKSLFKEVEWLKTSIITYKIEERKGRYWVIMVFTDQSNPLKKLLRPINDCATRERAEWYANILQRQISADPRDRRPKQPPNANNILSN